MSAVNFLDVLFRKFSAFGGTFMIRQSKGASKSSLMDFDAPFIH